MRAATPWPSSRASAPSPARDRVGTEAADRRTPRCRGRRGQPRRSHGRGSSSRRPAARMRRPSPSTRSRCCSRWYDTSSPPMGGCARGTGIALHSWHRARRPHAGHRRLRCDRAPRRPDRAGLRHARPRVPPQRAGSGRGRRDVRVLRRSGRAGGHPVAACTSRRGQRAPGQCEGAGKDEAGRVSGEHRARRARR